MGLLSSIIKAVKGPSKKSRNKSGRGAASHKRKSASSSYGRKDKTRDRGPSRGRPYTSSNRAGGKQGKVQRATSKPAAKKPSWADYAKSHISSGGTSGHRSGGTNKSYRPTQRNERTAGLKAAKAYRDRQTSEWKKFQKQKAELSSKGQISATGARVKTHTGKVGSGKKAATFKAKDLTMGEYTQLQNAMRLGANKGNKALGDKLARKVGSMTAYQANKNTAGRVAHGFLQGSSYGDVEGVIGKYGKTEKRALKEARESTAGNIGYGAGFMANAAIGGVGSLGKSIAGIGTKSVVKGATKGATKGVTKAVTKGVTKTAPKVADDLATVTNKAVTKASTSKAASTTAKQVSKSARKKFVKNRVAEVAAETPSNVVDAAKMSKDENGKVDVKKMAGYMALNTGMTAGMGGTIEKVGQKLTKKNADDYIKLLRKEAKEGLSEAEQAKKVKLKEKVDRARKDVQDSKSVIAEQKYNEGQSLQQDIRTQRRHGKAVERQNKVDDVNFAKSVDDVITGKIKTGEKLDVGRTPNVLQKQGASNARMSMKQATVRKMAYPEGYEDALKGLDRRARKQKSKGHNLGIGSVKTVRKDLENPKYIFKSATQDNSFVVVTNKVDKKGNPVIVAVHMDKEGRIGLDNEVASGYAKPEEFIENQIKQGNLLDDRTKKGPVNGLQGNGLQLPERDDPLDPMIKLQQNKVDVKDFERRRPNGSDKKSTIIDPETGEVYTKEQAEKRIAELRKEYDAENAKAKKAVAHKANARKAGRDKAHLDELQKQADEADKRQAEISDQVENIRKQLTAQDKANSGKPKGIEALENDKDIPKGLGEDPPAPKVDDPIEAKTNIKPEDVNPKRPKSKVGQVLENKSSAFIRRWVSSLHDFEKTAMKTGDKELLNQTTQVYLAKNRLSSWVEGARAGFDRKVSGKGLNKIYEDAGLFGKKNAEKKADFTNYLTYKHAIDRLEADKPVHLGEDGKSLYTAEQYQDMIDDIVAKYTEKGELKQLENFEADVRGYFDDLMKYRVDTGLVTKEFADELSRKYPNYVPTYRDGDEWVSGVITQGDSQKAGVKSTINAATGGQAPIEDLYSQMIKRTEDVLKNGEENAMLNMFARAKGFGPEAIPKGATMDDAAAAAISVSGSKSDGWRVTFFHEGEPVTMACDEGIARGLRELNGTDYSTMMNAFTKVVANKPVNTFGTYFKHFITDWNILFGVRNGARDFQQALVNTKDLRRFGASIPSAYASIARSMTGKESAFMKLYQANGGKYSQLVRQGKKFKEPGSDGVITGAVKFAPKKVTDMLEGINGAIELGPRMCEFVGTLSKHADSALKEQGSSLKKMRKELMEEMYPGKAQKELTSDQIEALEEAYANKIVDLCGKEAVDEAMRNSADITLNFSRSGDFGRTLNAGAVPYLNPSLQGLSKTIRLFTEGKADKALLNLVMKLSTFTLAPAAFNEIALKDNKDFQSLNTREKDSNFFIPIGDGKFIKVPKPRESAVLAEPVGYGLRYFFDKAQIGAIEKGEYSGEKMFQMWDTAWDNIGPVNPLTDNIVSPLVRLWQNKTWYGGSIDSISDTIALRDNTKSHSEIYDEKTSALAIEIGNKKIGGKTISDRFKLSPKKIDDLMDSYFGVIYDMGILSYKGTRPQVGTGNPFVNQFIKDSVFSNKNGAELWNEFQHLNAPKTTGGKIVQKGKDFIFGNNKHNISEKTVEAEDWLNLKGYDDMTYSGAVLHFQTSGDFKGKNRQDLIREAKKQQNEFRRDLTYGNGVVTPAKDPIRKLSKLVGVDYALENLTYTSRDEETGEEYNQHRDAWRRYKQSAEYKNDKTKNSQKFLNFYTQIRYTNGQIGESKSFPNWMTASILCATGKGNNTALAKAYIAPDGSEKQSASERQNEYIQRGLNYAAYTGTKEDYVKAQRNLFLGSRQLKNKYMRELQDYDSAMILAAKKHNDLQFYAADSKGYKTQRMNPARCLVANGHSTAEIHKFAHKYDLDVKSKAGWTGDDWKAYKNKVKNAVEQEYKGQPAEIRAAAYHVIVGDDWNSPYGAIGNYSRKDDTGIAELDKSSGYGGYGRRRGRRGWGRRGGRGGRGGSGGSSVDWYSYVDDLFGDYTPNKPYKPKSKKLKDNSHASRINEAYRNRAKKRQMITKK